MLAAEDVMHTAGLKRFYDYWNSLPKTAHMPDRQDFNPAAIHTLMPNVTILELVSPNFVLARLIGTAIATTLGVDMTGHNYLDYIADGEREGYLKMLALQFSVPCGRRTFLRGRLSTGVLGRIDVVSLPMFYARSGHPMLLNYFESMERTGIDAAEHREVLGFDDIQWLDIGAGVPPER
ncbi:MAG: PAS domain-containing protein [Parvibaculaceae bacterium]